jgi:hypothetical protein
MVIAFTHPQSEAMLLSNPIGRMLFFPPGYTTVAVGICVDPMMLFVLMKVSWSGISVILWEIDALILQGTFAHLKAKMFKENRMFWSQVGYFLSM